MTTLSATLSIAILVFAASRILAAEEIEGPPKVDILQCLQPEYIPVTKEQLGEIEPTRTIGGPHLPIKVKRDIGPNPSNLIPFPRIGRGYPHIWAPGYDNGEVGWFPFYRYLMEMVPGVKRFGSGLIPFPRVGRSGTGPKRNGAGGGGSLWFGPRLGKRNFDHSPYQSPFDARLFDGDFYAAPNQKPGETDEPPKPEWAAVTG